MSTKDERQADERAYAELVFAGWEFWHVRAYIHWYAYSRRVKCISIGKGKRPRATMAIYGGEARFSGDAWADVLPSVEQTMSALRHACRKARRR